jgi:hypothetical protein
MTPFREYLLENQQRKMTIKMNTKIKYESLIFGG